MTPLAFLLKSYSGDFSYAQRLLDSFHRHNRDDIHLYCVVPTPDMPMFAALSGPRVTVLDEVEFSDHLVGEPLNGYRVGYINQEIVKLAFWEAGLAENYFCVDSDAVFIRDFGVQDFLTPSGEPYTVLVEDKELQVEPRYFREHWRDRDARLRLIADEIGWEDPVLLTCHGHQLFSTAVLRSFRDDFLASRGWDYRNALAIAPYEFTWYNLWLQKSRAIPIHVREPWVKVFHNENQHLEYVMRGVQVEDISRAYLAVVVNSNFSRDLGLVDVHASKPASVAQYLSYGELAQVLSHKVRDTAARRLPRRHRG